MAMLYKYPEGNNDYTIMLEISEEQISLNSSFSQVFSKWLHETGGLSSSCRRGVVWCFERCPGASTAVGTGAGDFAGLLIEWIQWADAEWCFILLIYYWYIIDIWLIYYWYIMIYFKSPFWMQTIAKKRLWVVTCLVRGERIQIRTGQSAGIS